MTVPQLLQQMVPPVPPQGGVDDRDWAQRLRAGDKSAFEELFHAYYPQLVTFATRIVGSGDAAEEVVQDVFLAIWRHCERGDLSAIDLRAYVFGAVRKGATSHMRHADVERRWQERASRGQDIPKIAPVPAADEETRFNEVMTAVRAVVDELPPRTRQAFLLRRQHGLSFGEIAQVMDIAPKTVEAHIGAALRTLRARLSRFYD